MKIKNSLGSETVEEHLRVKCFCGQWVTVGYAGEDKAPVLLHPTPECLEFMKDQPLDKFLASLRHFHSGAS